MKSRSSFSSAILLRFLPALVAVYGLIASALTISEPHGFTVSSLGALAIELAGLTTGYAASLGALGAVDSRRNSLGRRHALCGFLAPLTLGLLSPFVLGVSSVGILSLSVGGGVLTGFIAWVTLFRAPRPPKPSLEELEAKVDAELASLDSGLGADLRLMPRPGKDKSPRQMVA